ncbi:hypothetical protein AC249_AIPGENE18540 [Exaiptasia diaphana]|nr:hypothetical protein AC249_AIPGENE18540 [Exaiptasia diaphana]
MNVPDECYMFNYYSQDKKCQLLYKDRLLDYKVVKRSGSAFKTRKCKKNTCKNGGLCYSLGDVSHVACICKSGFSGNSCETSTTGAATTAATETTAAVETTKAATTATGAATSASGTTGAEITTAPATAATTGAPTTGAPTVLTRTVPATAPVVTVAGTPAPTKAGDVYVKVSTSKVCYGTKDDSYGRFTVTKNGRIRTFKLVYVSGTGLKNELLSFPGKWGTGFGPVLWITRIETHITDASDKRITPPVGYTLDDYFGRMGYDVPGYNYNTDTLVFPFISPTMNVKVGDKFRIWYGADLKNAWEDDNSGETCADVYALYSEISI